MDLGDAFCISGKVVSFCNTVPLPLFERSLLSPLSLRLLWPLESFDPNCSLRLSSNTLFWCLTISAIRFSEVVLLIDVVKKLYFEFAVIIFEDVQCVVLDVLFVIVPYDLIVWQRQLVVLIKRLLLVCLNGKSFPIL